MRIARFAAPTGLYFGVVEGPADALLDALTVSAIEEHPFGEIRFTGERWALPDVRLLAPVLPTKVIGIGRNYLDHAAEMGGEMPTQPVFFLKPSTSVIGPNDAIRLPADAKRVDFEGELAAVVGRVAHEVPVAKALDVLLGFTCGNDVTARDQQSADGQWTRAKGHDSFCPLGPWVETVLDPSDLQVRTELDGEVRQEASTAELRFQVASLVSYVSHVMTLLPGDVILTGTPAGVGPMRAGQQVAVTVQGVGTLRNPVVHRAPADV